MIGTEDLCEIIETAIWTGYIQGEKPISLLIVSRVESGKSQMVIQYDKNAGVELLEDMTAWALTNPKGKTYQRLVNHEIHHIICPDLLRPLARNRDTVNTLITFLLGLLEEGVIHIETYMTKLSLPEPLRCGLITTIARDEMELHRHQWMRLGFMSRLLPVSYEYSPNVQMRIARSIASRDYVNDGYIALQLPPGPIAVDLPEHIAQQIMTLTPAIIASQDAASKLYGFRLQKQLQAFVMAQALRHGRDQVNQEDFDRMAILSKYWNLRYTSI